MSARETTHTSIEEDSGAILIGIVGTATVTFLFGLIVGYALGVIV